MSDFASTLKEGNVHNLHRLVKNGDKQYLCFTKINKNNNWSILVSDGIDVWMQEYDEDSLEALRDLSGLNAMDAYLAKFKNGFSSGNLSVTKIQNKVTFIVGSGGSVLELDLFEAKAADKKIELQSILFRLTEHCTKLESDLASTTQQVERLKAQKAAGGGVNALMDFGQKKEVNQKTKPTKAGMSVINPTSRKRKAAAGVVFGDDDD